MTFIAIAIIVASVFAAGYSTARFVDTIRRDRAEQRALDAQMQQLKARACAMGLMPTDGSTIAPAVRALWARAYHTAQNAQDEKPPGTIH